MRRCTGRDPEELLELEPEDVLNKIGTFTEAEKHCETLSIKALQEAVNRQRQNYK